MQKNIIRHSLAMYVLLFSLCLYLTSCGSTHVVGNAINGVTPTASTSSPTPASTANSATPTTLSTTSTSTSHQSSGSGNDYAFIRNNQVWIALQGAVPIQATHFAPAMPPNYAWSGLHWFAQDRYLAFTVDISERGGNYCLLSPLMGQLFVIDTSTMQSKAITPQGVIATQQVPVDGAWSTLTPQDDTHLLAWFSDKGIYRYDFTTQSISLLIPQTHLPAMQGMVVSSMTVRNGLLYYSSITKSATSAISHFMIYSIPLSSGNETSSTVFDAGTETICSSDMRNDGPIKELAWDISPDGTHLVTLAIDNSNPGQPQGKVEIVDVQSGTTTPIFTSVPAKEGVSKGFVALSWSPDGHTIMLLGTYTLYTSDTNNPGAFQTYNIQYPLGTFVSWQAQGTRFTADNQNNVDIYTVGKPDGQVLLTNGKIFAGGNQ